MVLELRRRVIVGRERSSIAQKAKEKDVLQQEERVNIKTQGGQYTRLAYHILEPRQAQQRTMSMVLATMGD